MSQLYYLGKVENEIFALDPNEKRFVRLILKEDQDEEIGLFSGIEAIEMASSEPPDPARPELSEALAINQEGGKIRARRVKKILGDLFAPDNFPPLWLPGPSVKYASMTGDSPSVALIRLGKEQALLRDPRSNEVQFGFPWKGGFHAFPLSPKYQELLAQNVSDTVTSKKGIKGLLDMVPGALVLAFSPPRDGYCKKIVVSILPKL